MEMHATKGWVEERPNPLHAIQGLEERLAKNEAEKQELLEQVKIAYEQASRTADVARKLLGIEPDAYERPKGGL